MRRALIALALGVAIAGPRSIARHYTFPAAELPIVPTPDDLRASTVVARDGAPVHLLEAASSGARTVVYFHNNRETAEARADLARALAARGLGAVLVEYRGYGLSRDAGAPSEDGLYLDAEGALDALAARGVGPERIVLWGTSLGSGVAAEMARRGRGARLVLVAPFTSIPELVPVAPLRALMPDRFDTLAKAPAIHLPALVVHGDADEIVPFTMGERIASALPDARLLAVRGGRHGDLFARDGSRIYDAVAALAR